MADKPIPPIVREALQRGVVIPASPLALNRRLQLDERRQRGLWRYYAAAGAGGVAVGVHTTQFAIRDPKIGLFQPLLALAAEEFDRADAARAGAAEADAARAESPASDSVEAGVAPSGPLIRVAGICGRTEQAVAEATLARDLRFHVGLLSLGALGDGDDETLLAHCRAVAEVIPLFGFYLQPAVGGRVLGYEFWRRFAEIEGVVAIKVAPFNRYQTLDVVRALAESGRDDVALCTGNDDNIVLDLLTPYSFRIGDRIVVRRFVGGLLGHWAVWTRRAVELLDTCHWLVATAQPVPARMLRLAVQVTDANAALFDAANGFAGCIAGIHEVLRRQGLLEGIWCLDPKETLSPGQGEEIDRVLRQYPHLTDDEFVARHREEWLAC